MDMTIADLISFNEFLDSAIDPEGLDEEFITLRLVELDDISKNSDVEHFHLIALSYAKLMELTVLLAGKFADNCQMVDFGDLVVNPRHIDVCVLNTGLITEEYGVADSMPLWFKAHVRECIGSQYTEDLGRMVVDPSSLFHFVEKGLLLRIVKKERHTRLSEQFRGCLQSDARLAFPQYIGEVEPIARSLVKELGCGSGRGECPDVASWIATNTVLNIVKGSLKSDIMNVLRGVMSGDYLKSIDKRLEKASNSLSYVNMGRKNIANFPYDDEVSIADWTEINHTLCHFTLDEYGMVQSEFDKSLSNSYYKSHFLNRLLYNYPKTQGSGDQKHHVKFQHHPTTLKQSSRINTTNRLN